MSCKIYSSTLKFATTFQKPMNTPRMFDRELYMYQNKETGVEFVCNVLRDLQNNEIMEEMSNSTVDFLSQEQSGLEIVRNKSCVWVSANCT